MSDDPILIVIQLGSTHVRCGISGDDAPRRVLMNVIDGRNPALDGFVEDSADFARIIRGCVGDDLDCATETQGILICDSSLVTQDQRKQLASVLFDTLRFPAVLFYSRPALCAFSAGRVTGVVIELGDEHTVVTAVHQCNRQRQSVLVGPVSGRALSSWLLSKTNELNQDIDITEATTAPSDVGSIKRQCVVAKSHIEFTEAYTAALKEPPTSHAGNIILLRGMRNQRGEVVQELQTPAPAILALAPEALFFPQLLDGVVPGSDKFLDAKGDRMSLPELVIKSVRTLCDDALEAEVLQNVIIAGRGSMFAGLKERLEIELRSLLPPAQVVEVVADDARSSGAWIGGSILTSMRSTADNGFVTAAQWEAHGPDMFDSWSTQ